MIYVDPPKKYSAAQIQPAARRNGVMWSHLWCDSGEEEQLHAFAARLGMKKAWFQDKPGFPHYDLVPRRQALAVSMGANLVLLSDWVKARYLRHDRLA